MTGGLRRLLAVLPASAVLMVATACASPKEDKPLPTKHEADVTSLVQSYAQTAATSLGATVRNWKTISAPCEGRNGEVANDGRWNLTGHANIPVPEGEHAGKLQQLRDQLQRQGYEITEFRTIPPDNKEAVLSARNPANGVSISLESSATPTLLALLIGTPCYKPEPGEHPAS